MKGLRSKIEGGGGKKEQEAGRQQERRSGTRRKEQEGVRVEGGVHVAAEVMRMDCSFLSRSDQERTRALQCCQRS